MAVIKLSNFCLKAIIAIFLAALLAGCSGGLFAGPHEPAMAISVSTDGQYAVSSHQDNKLYLWNLDERTVKKLADDANVYSATFIHNESDFLWQDLDQTVRRQTVDGQILDAFQHFPTYGHIYVAARDIYISADEDYNLYSGYGEERQAILRDGISPSFMGSGKLLNLSLAAKEPLLVTAGSGSDDDPIDAFDPVDPDRRFSKYGGVTLWNIETEKAVAKLRGNSFKTHAVISPDGQWVISADENVNGFYWDTSNPSERNRLASAGFGIFMEDSPYELGDERNWDDSKIIDPPPGTTDTTIALAFIHKSKYYLRFGNYSHQAALFKTGSPWPQKYFDLGEEPYLVTYGSQYSRNTAIASSPEAGVLVMGHAESGGISVYQFDEEKLTLERVWVNR